MPVVFVEKSLCRLFRKKKASSVKAPTHLFRAETRRVDVRHVVVTKKQDKVTRSVNPISNLDDIRGHFVGLECVGQQSRAASFNGSGVVDGSHVIENNAREYLKIVKAVQDHKSFVVVENQAIIVGRQGTECHAED